MRTKKILLFTIIWMIFILFLIPLMYPFGFIGTSSIDNGTQAGIGFAYVFWYLMCFIFAICFGQVMVKQGCWFFKE